jgi:hypothetical protein
LSEDTYCTGEYSYWQNAIRTGPSGGSSETAKMFPEGWASGTGETRSETIDNNAARGLWLPLYIPAGCDGHVGALDPDTGVLLPEVIYYAANFVASSFDQKFGELDDANRAQRISYAAELGLDAAKNTSGGGPNVRETA